MEKEDESSAQKGRIMSHTVNPFKTARERSRINNASKFYGKDTEDILARHKSMWRTHGGSGDMGKFAKTPEEAEKLRSMTLLELLEYQVQEYERIESFSSCAYQGKFVSFYHTHDAPSIAKCKSATMDRRPERVLVVRTCPSKMIVEKYIPEEVRKIKPRHNEHYWQTIGGEGGQERQFDYIPEEEKNISLMIANGLGKDVKVAFVYTVPYAPSTKWDKNVPPPEQAEHFCHYLKLAIAAHARASILVCMNLWCTKLIVAKCNADQVIHVQELPSYGEHITDINIYPLGVKNKNIRAMGRKMIRIPHNCMWMEEGTDSSNEMRNVFINSMKKIQDELHSKSRKNANPFELMMKKRANSTRKEPSAHSLPPTGAETERKKEDKPPKAKKKKIDSRVAKTMQMLEKLHIICVSSPEDPNEFYTARPPDPVTYNQSQWMIPEIAKNFRPDVVKCDCPVCGGTSEWCNTPTDVASFEGKEPEDYPLCDLPCDYCCCKHGHRNAVFGCVAVANMGVLVKGCRGWRIPYLKHDTPSLIDMVNTRKTKRFTSFLCISKKDIPTCKKITRTRGKGTLASLQLGMWDVDVGLYKNLEASISGNDINIRGINLCKAPTDIPSLVMLCVEKIRRMADPENATDEEQLTTLNRNVASKIHRELRDKLFPQCNYDVIGDHTIKYMANGTCCARHTKPERFKTIKDVREYNAKMVEFVDTNTMTMTIWV